MSRLVRRSWLVAIVIALLNVPVTASAARDVTPPRTRISFMQTPSASGWFRSPVTVKLSAVDRGSGVATVWYSDNGWSPAAWGLRPARTKYNLYFRIDRVDGVHVVRYRSVDAAGNRERIHTVGIRFDANAPRVDVWEAAPSAYQAGWTKGSWTVYARCSDSGSGCARWSIGADGAMGPYGGPFGITAEGRHTVRWIAADVAGNKSSTHTRAYNIDRGAPSVTMRAPDGVVIARTTTRLEAYANDVPLADGTPGSGVINGVFLYRDASGVHGGPPAERGSDGVWRAEADLRTGTYDVWMVARDVATNAGSSKPVTIRVQRCPFLTDAKTAQDYQDIQTCATEYGVLPV